MTYVSDAHAGARASGRSRAAIIVVTVLAILALIFSGGSFAFAKSYDGKALPGTTFLGEDISGMTQAQIAELVTQRAADVAVDVNLDGTAHTATLADLGVSVDPDSTAAQAVDPERSATATLTAALRGEQAVEPSVTVDEVALREYAASLIPADRTAPVDATLIFDAEEKVWNITEAVNGQGVDPTDLVDTVKAHAASLMNFSVDQPVTDIAPSITTEEAQASLAEINSMLEQPVSIAGPDGSVHTPSAETRAGWFTVTPNEDGSALVVAVDEEAVRGWVAHRAERDSVEVKDGIEQVDEEGNTVKVVAEKQDGLEVTNTDDVAAQLIAALTGKSPLEAAFETKTIPAKVEKAEAPKPGQEQDAADPNAPAPTGEKWIDVNLSNKTVTAYVGNTVVWGPRLMVDGGAGYETVTGSYNIYLRYDKQDMTNRNYYPEGHPKYYYTPDVPWVQYFYRGYAFHGAPWRSSFGYSGSHGCINLPVADAKWLYDWAGLGVRVEVHY